MPQPDILALLPHRAPMLMVDRVLELGEDGCRALKHISHAEPCFRGHFPNDPIFPGVLIVEALAQTCALWLSSGGEGGLPIFAGIASAVFRRKVRPGDALVLSARLISERKGFYTFQTQAEVEGQCVCSAELTVCRRNGRPEDQSKSSVAVGKLNADMGGNGNDTDR